MVQWIVRREHRRTWPELSSPPAGAPRSRFRCCRMQLGSHNSLHSHLGQPAPAAGGGSAGGAPQRSPSTADVDMQGTESTADGVLAPIALQVRGARGWGEGGGVGPVLCCTMRLGRCCEGAALRHQAAAQLGAGRAGHWVPQPAVCIVCWHRATSRSTRARRCTTSCSTTLPTSSFPSPARCAWGSLRVCTGYWGPSVPH